MRNHEALVEEFNDLHKVYAGRARALGISRELSLAITKLQEAHFWIGQHLEGIGAQSRLEEDVG